MAVSARSARILPAAANVRHEGIDTSLVPAGTYVIEVGEEIVTGWHFHDLHQLEYAIEGVTEVETATARYLLPPRQAIWIPASVAHCSTLTRVKAVSVFFDPAMHLPAGDRVRVLATPPLMREMILYARRWPISRTSSDARADAFFEALAHLVVEWSELETPLCLPISSHPLVTSAMKYTADHLPEVTLPEVCACIGTSERTLRRAFVTSTGMPWRRYLLESRLLKAMALLAGERQNVLAIALDVGFRSVSAFTRAFREYAGETPTEYRRRIRTGRDV